MSAPLSASDIGLALNELPGWTHEDDRLNRELGFSSFRQAVAFVTRLSFECEELNHHPEIYMVYDRMALALTTHDAGDKVTKRDFLLAHKIEQILREFHGLPSEDE